MNFVFNPDAMKENPYTKEAKLFVDKALSKLKNSYMDQDKVNRMLFYYYSNKKDSTISIYFQEVTGKIGLVTNQFVYSQKMNSNANSLEIFETIISTLHTNGYEVLEKKFSKGQKFKKSAKIELL